MSESDNVAGGDDIPPEAVEEILNAAHEDDDEEWDGEEADWGDLVNEGDDED
jgi:hypothetical protein